MLPELTAALLDQTQENVNGIQDHAERLLQSLDPDGSLAGLSPKDQDLIRRTVERIDTLRQGLNEFMLRRACELDPDPPLGDTSHQVIEFHDDQGGPTVYVGSYDDCVEFISAKGDDWSKFSIINSKTKHHVSFTLA